MQLLTFAALFLLFFSGHTSLTCPDGYSTIDNKMCYKVYNVNLNRTDAAARCDVDGGYLASINNAVTENYIYSLANNTGGVWLGIICNTTVLSDCVNDDGTPFGPYNYFNRGHPNGNDAYECIQMSEKYPTSKLWSNYICSFEQPFVCEVNVRTEANFSFPRAE